MPIPGDLAPPQPWEGIVNMPKCLECWPWKGPERAVPSFCRYREGGPERQRAFSKVTWLPPNLGFGLEAQCPFPDFLKGGPLPVQSQISWRVWWGREGIGVQGRWGLRRVAKMQSPGSYPRPTGSASRGVVPGELYLASSNSYAAVLYFINTSSIASKLSM